MLLHTKIYSEIYKYQTYIYKYSNNSYIEVEILQYLQDKNILVLSESSPSGQFINFSRLIFSENNVLSPSGKEYKLLIVTQYIEGKVLDHTLSNTYKFNDLRYIILQILDIFIVLHNNNIIYGDDIYHNMIITDSLDVYIIDFGNSCFAHRKKLYHSFENDLRVLTNFISPYIHLDQEISLKQMYSIVYEASASS